MVSRYAAQRGVPAHHGYRARCPFTVHRSRFTVHRAVGGCRGGDACGGGVAWGPMPMPMPVSTAVTMLVVEVAAVAGRNAVAVAVPVGAIGAVAAAGCAGEGVGIGVWVGSSLVWQGFCSGNDAGTLRTRSFTEGDR